MPPLLAAIEFIAVVFSPLVGRLNLAEIAEDSFYHHPADYASNCKLYNCLYHCYHLYVYYIRCIAHFQGGSMKKRIISLFLVLAVSLSMFCPLAFADDSSTHEHDWSSGIISEFSDTVEGIPVSVSVKKCTKCNFYKHTYKFFGLSFDFYNVTAYTGIVDDFLLDVTLHISSALGKNATASKYETGGGSAGTGGVGRHPSGYQDSTGTPSINLDGVYIFALSHDYTYARINAASKTSSSTEDSKYSFPVYRYCADSTLKSTFDQGTITESGDSVKYSVKFDEYKYSGYFGERFKGVAPCDGQYSLYIRPKYSISGSVFSSSYNDSVFRSSSGNLGLYGLDSYYVAGSTISIYSNVSLNYIGGYYPKSVTYQFTGVPYLKCKGSCRTARHG